MRKIFVPFIILIILILGFRFVLAVLNTQNKPPEHSKEELYQDMTLSLLLPYIQNEVDKYYSTYLTQPPMVYPYTVYVINAERPNGYRTFFFRLKLQVNSYIGPHINVGLDYLTVTIDGSGNVKIEEFEHIESYELPSNYEDIIKKGYKNSIP